MKRHGIHGRPSPLCASSRAAALDTESCLQVQAEEREPKPEPEQGQGQIVRPSSFLGPFLLLIFTARCRRRKSSGKPPAKTMGSVQ